MYGEEYEESSTSTGRECKGRSTVVYGEYIYEGINYLNYERLSVLIASASTLLVCIFSPPYPAFPGRDNNLSCPTYTFHTMLTSRPALPRHEALLLSLTLAPTGAKSSRRKSRASSAPKTRRKAPATTLATDLRKAQLDPDPQLNPAQALGLCVPCDVVHGVSCGSGLTSL